LGQGCDFAGADLSVQDADTQLVADRGSVHVKDMLEASALETGEAGVVNEVVLEEKNEIHEKIQEI
jgi:hypothetical protein